MGSLIIHVPIFLLFLITLLPTRTAFTPTGFFCRTTALYDTKKNNDPAEESPFDADTARRRLESLLGDTNSNSKKTDVSLLEILKIDDFLFALPPPPPLSTIERDRRTAEIRILKNLENGDDALADLWSLWYSERGSTAQLTLKETDQLLGDPTSWRECETKLLQLIEDYGIYFVEPVNRLATLYYLQGKLQESYKLCQIVLKIKPWHFGALSGIVQVCISMGDMDAARLWAEKHLPSNQSETSPLPSPSDGQSVNPRRTEWVENAILVAKEMQKQAEKTTQQRLGKPEEYYGKSANRNGNSDGEADAWQ